ncbi:transportin-2 [Dermacentor silvarum]|nr:transportin-2 [Dermacentor silvarum]
MDICSGKRASYYVGPIIVLHGEVPLREEKEDARLALSAFHSVLENNSDVMSGRYVGFPFVKKSGQVSSPWEPQEERLQQILQLLKESLSAEEEARLTARRAIKQLSELPDFISYLVFIIAELKFENEHLTKPTGLLLDKDGTANSGNVPLNVTDSTRTSSFESVGDPLVVIVAALGFFITTDATLELTRWPELLPRLGELLDSKDDRVCEGSFGALHKICRDYAAALDTGLLKDQLTALAPKFLKFFRHSNPRIRFCAITFISLLFLNRAHAVIVHADSAVTSLLQLLYEEDSKVQKTMWRALIVLLEYQIDCLIPHMRSIIEYAMVKMQDTDESVALEACTTLACLTKKPVCKEALAPCLSRLVTILLQGMKYSDADLRRCKEDVRRIQPTPGQTKKATEGNIGGSSVRDKIHADDNIFYKWNMRNCSADALDGIAMVFNEEVFHLLLPFLKEMLHKDWVTKESAIFILGVIAEGCMEGMSQYLEDLITYLLLCLRDNEAPVRSAACWTLSRYSHWVLSQPHHRYFEPLLNQLLERVMDDSEMVQEVACNALITLTEEAKTKVVPYLNAILDTIYCSFSKYRRPRFYMLYNAIRTLADCVGPELKRREFILFFMKPLTDEWDEMADGEVNLFCLLRCLSSVATAVKSEFLPYHMPVAKRCVHLVQLGMQGFFVEALRLRKSYTPKKPFVVAALATLSGLAEGLEREIRPLVADTNIVELMFQCGKDPVPEVRQVTFALLGNLTRGCFDCLVSVTCSFLPILGENLNPELKPVCNNATWAISEITMKLRSAVKPHMSDVVTKLVTNMKLSNTSKTLLANTAIALGCLGRACPEEMAPKLLQFIGPCCSALGKVQNCEAKDFAFSGICSMARVNPDGVILDFFFFLEAILSWAIPKEDLKQTVNDLLHRYKKMFGSKKWQQFSEQLPPALRGRMLDHYGI